MDLAGAVALVTGASRGVGRALAIALATVGADVACAARATDAAPLKLPGTIDSTVREIEARGRRGLAVPTDLSRPEQVEAMVARTIETFGRLDILVNNAAITFAGDSTLPMKRWDLVMEVNLRAPLIAAKAALAGMCARRTGTILNVSSAAAVMPIPGLLVYGVSKAGLERLTTGLAAEVAPHAIAVNCLRIDVPLASEGFVYNAPELDKSDWEPPEVGAEAALWMLAQPATYTGRVTGITALRRDHGVAPTRLRA
ncbi:MAG TPA: SDR family NAD(P)-dependent oxidoreductase [Candidatus Binatus sp.]|jgi:citronellol/citronellal dehydrogenase|nr:SDR family NAD(P)-dependent oxidoreductase [Candidatus Binatus sp.]